MRLQNSPESVQPAAPAVCSSWNTHQQVRSVFPGEGQTQSKILCLVLIGSFPTILARRGNHISTMFPPLWVRISHLESAEVAKSSLWSAYKSLILLLFSFPSTNTLFKQSTSPQLHLLLTSHTLSTPLSQSTLPQPLSTDGLLLLFASVLWAHHLATCLDSKSDILMLSWFSSWASASAAGCCPSNTLCFSKLWTTVSRSVFHYWWRYVPLCNIQWEKSSQIILIFRANNNRIHQSFNHLCGLFWDPSNRSGDHGARGRGGWSWSATYSFTECAGTGSWWHHIMCSDGEGITVLQILCSCCPLKVNFSFLLLSV